MALRAGRPSGANNKKSVPRKSMKSKRVSTIARGRFARALVFQGKKIKTASGLKQESLMRNRRGKIVSKRASAQGKRMYKNVESWVECVMEARDALHCKGFVAINGKTLQGKALYVKAKALRTPRHAAAFAVATVPVAPQPFEVVQSNQL